jgi:NAD(P)-dependent dehydrogenase (short-subunit alcohol dehydrogenase family)
MANQRHVLVVPTDVTEPSSVRSLFAATKEAFNRLDVLFNNAGASTPPKSIEDISIESWRIVLETNVTGTFLCTQEAIRLMKQQEPKGGRIINNGSIAVHSPRPHAASSTATKQAIWGLTKATSLDGRPFDIACGQINIGNANTSMTREIKTGVLQADGSVAIEPTIDLDCIARAVVYMASLPLNANVLSLDVMATKMPLVGRG